MLQFADLISDIGARQLGKIHSAGDCANFRKIADTSRNTPDEVKPRV